MAVYSAVVIANSLRHSKEKKTPSVAIQVRTTANLESGEQVSKTLTGDLWLTPGTSERTMENLAHVFGWCGATIAELNSPILAGIEIEVSTTEEEYNGRRTEKVAYYNRPGESTARALAPSEAAEARAIASAFDSVLRAYKAKGGHATKITKREEPQYQSESGYSANDDLPY